MSTAERLWHPLASLHDLVPRHVFWGRLLGRELAVWRADDGFVNVWENRCLHRGVRLSVGTNDGRELICRYHGWRYASRTAGCTYIPAHPADAPARTICNRTFPSLIATHSRPGAEDLAALSTAWKAAASSASGLRIPVEPDGSGVAWASAQVSSPAGPRDVGRSLRQKQSKMRQLFH